MRKNIFLFCLSITIFAFLTGCASIVDGTQQTVSVKTSNTAGASCSLENNKGKWYVNNTPASVTIHKSYSDLDVVCHKNGYYNSEKKVGSKTSGMVFGNAISGVGGIVGGGVDVSNGAAYEYPVEIDVSMRKIEKNQ